MASGTVALTAINTNGSILVAFTGAATFASGNLVVENTRDASSTVTAVTAGVNTITGLGGGVRYIIYVESYDATPAYLGTSNHLLVSMPSYAAAGTWPEVETWWKTDRIDWQEIISSVGDDHRISLPVNSRGYWFQFRGRCTEQNARLMIHDVKVGVRVKGRGERGRSG